jgi:hypothetical protein
MDVLIALLRAIWGKLTNWAMRLFACAKGETCKPCGSDMESLRVAPATYEPLRRTSSFGNFITQPLDLPLPRGSHAALACRYRAQAHS